MRGIARGFVAAVAWTLVAIVAVAGATAQEASESASPSDDPLTITVGTTTDIRTTNPLRSMTAI